MEFIFTTQLFGDINDVDIPVRHNEELNIARYLKASNGIQHFKLKVVGSERIIKKRDKEQLRWLEMKRCEYLVSNATQKLNSLRTERRPFEEKTGNQCHSLRELFW